MLAGSAAKRFDTALMLVVALVEKVSCCNSIASFSINDQTWPVIGTHCSQSCYSEALPGCSSTASLQRQAAIASE